LSILELDHKPLLNKLKAGIMDDDTAKELKNVVENLDY
jgi:hypothetical protein